MYLHCQELSWKPKLICPCQRMTIRWKIFAVSAADVLMKSEDQQVNYVSEMQAVGQRLFCGVWVFFRSLLLKFWRKDQEDTGTLNFADAPGKQQHLQLVSNLPTRGVRNKNKDSYDPSDNTEQVCFLVRHKWQTHRLWKLHGSNLSCLPLRGLNFFSWETSSLYLFHWRFANSEFSEFDGTAMKKEKK